jgi:5-formyltetrahydrofolate cyclo-ligase
VTARARGVVPAGTFPDPAAGKAEWRRRIRAARRARDADVHARHAALLTAAVLDLAATTGGPICAYLPVGVEPWSPLGVEELRAAGHEILLPVVAGADAPLDWALYDGPGALVPGPFGLREPTGPRLGPGTVSRARLVLLPALAADRRGVRLGQGGGFYDRTLPLVGAEVPTVVVLDDGELVDTLPAEPHDRRVTAAVLPGSGVTMLGGAAC